MLICSALLSFFLADLVLDPIQTGGGVSSIGTTYIEFLLVGLATTVLLAGFLGFSELGEQRVLRYLGKISYGLYVYHSPSLIFAGKIVPRVVQNGVSFTVALVGFTMTIAIAAVSYRFLEMPFLFE